MSFAGTGIQRSGAIANTVIRKTELNIFINQIFRITGMFYQKYLLQIGNL